MHILISRSFGAAAVTFMLMGLLGSALAAEPVRSDSNPETKQGPRLLRVRVGGAAFGASHWYSDSHDDPEETFFGGAVLADIGVGKRFSGRRVGLYFDTSVARVPSQTAPDGIEDTFLVFLAGPNITLFGRCTGIEMDLTVGVSRMIATIGTNPENYTGLGLAAGLSYSFALGVFRIGPYVQATGTSGRMFGMEETYTWWNTWAAGGGLQAWY